MLGDDGALIGGHLPFAVRSLRECGDPRVPIDLCALDARGFRIGVGRAGRVQSTLLRIIDRAENIARVDERAQLPHFLGTDELRVKTQDAMARPVGAQEIPHRSCVAAILRPPVNCNPTSWPEICWISR